MLGQIYRCFKILLSKFKKETPPIELIEKECGVAPRVAPLPRGAISSEQLHMWGVSTNGIQTPSIILRHLYEAHEFTDSPNAELIPKFEAVFTGLIESGVDDFKIFKESDTVMLSDIVPDTLCEAVTEPVAEPVADTENQMV